MGEAVGEGEEGFVEGGFVGCFVFFVIVGVFGVKGGEGALGVRGGLGVVESFVVGVEVVGWVGFWALGGWWPGVFRGFGASLWGEVEF